MKFIRSCVLVLILLQLVANGQSSGVSLSHILRSNGVDTAVLHIELKGAFYDPAKGRMPFYAVQKITPYQQFATPSLIVKGITVVNEPHASVLKRYFGSFLTTDFVLEPVASRSRDQNLNEHMLFPFRINKSGVVEELTAYELSWQINQSNPLAQAKPAAPFASSSVLASGTWYKIGVTQTGVHKLTRSALNNMGINTNGLALKNIRIYGNGGGMVPEKNSSFRYDDLVENAIQVVDVGNDGVFDNEDYVLFFATGTTEWKRIGKFAAKGLIYSAVKSMYSDTSFYFVNVDLGDGKRVQQYASLSQPADYSTNSFDYVALHEENLVNFGKSGRDFFGEYFDFNNAYSFSWKDGDFVPGDTIVAETRMAALFGQTSNFSTSGNGLNYVNTNAGVFSSQYSLYASFSAAFGWALNTNAGEINLTVARQTPRAYGWLDKLTINARRSLNVSNRQFCFRDQRGVGAGKKTMFTLSNPGAAKFSVWNVSDRLHPVVQELVINGNQASFTAASDSLIEYCVANESDFYSPVFVGKVQNQNLHALNGVDYVIISHPLLLREADYVGQFHKKREGLSYLVANTEQIYNEFGSGKQDPAAIRDFIRMIYSRAKSNGKATQYVLLMGDGSYLNKNRNLVNNSNLIPTYQSLISLDPLESITTDDFYGLMDPEEGFNAEYVGRIDIGVGRFPCRNAEEAKSMIGKIENYYRVDQNFSVNNNTAQNCNSSSESTLGDWRNWLLFLGDDEDGALHMIQSDALTKLTNSIAPQYNIDKIFLDSYQRFSTPGGFRYPDAAEDFVKRIKKGAFIFNYTGHGGEVGLTSERIIDVDLINKLDNFNKLPLFITATCEFSRYDDPARTSAGEYCLLNAKGGALAMLTTCRVAFAGTNYTLNEKLLQVIFSPMPDGNMPNLGDAIRLTKAFVGQKSYYANFHLLGDPAITLAYPRNRVITSKINNNPVGAGSSDTLSALAKITVEGFVADTAGNKLSSFNGLVYPTVFDKLQDVTCLVNSDDSYDTVLDPTPENPLNTKKVPFEFKSQKNILYRGKAEVKNGEFSFSFLVPKDISYAVGPGKISYYATNGSVDGNGVYSGVQVGGDPKNTYPDNVGPQASVYLNEKSFVNGGITNENPVFYAELIDSSGINTLGTGFGHDISIILDENSSKPIILNDYYEANLNSYQSGNVRYPLSGLSEGEHRLSFKVWDIQNNSSTAYLDFVVAPSEELALNKVLNYPNPFTTRTKFLFEHNQACNPLKVTVQIYTVSGKLVKTISRSVTCEGYRQEGVEWDGRDDYGDKLGRGVYVYKLAILDVNNKKAEKIEKLVILN